MESVGKRGEKNVSTFFLSLCLLGTPQNGRIKLILGSAAVKIMLPNVLSTMDH